VARLAQRRMYASIQAVSQIDFGTHAAYNVTQGGFSFWARPTPSSGTVNPRLFSLSDGTRSIEVYLDNPTGTLPFGKWSVLGSAAAGGTVNAIANAWVHVLVTWTAGGALNLYINGVLVVSGTAPGAWTTDPRLRLAAWNGGGLTQPGAYTNARFYSGAISAAQALALYLNDLDPSTPIALWSFRNITGSTIPLTGGTGNNADFGVAGSRRITDVPPCALRTKQKIYPGAIVPGATGVISPTSALLKTYQGACSIAVRFKAKQFIYNNNQRIASLFTSLNDRVDFYVDIAGNIQCSFIRAGVATPASYTGDTTSTAQVVSDRWFQAIVAYDNLG
jgi:hypothetical protein